MKNSKKQLIRHLFSLATFFICLVSCMQQKESKITDDIVLPIQDQDAFFTIDFADIIKNKQEVYLSHIAESVEYIPLETTSESLLGRISDIQLTSEYIFIKHNGTPLLTVFDREGNFIRHIGSVGRGPNEYELMRMFSIDEKNRLIYIHSNWTHKILVYDFDGIPQETLQFATSGRGHISWSRDSFLVSFQEPQIGTDPFVFIETNQKGDTIQGIPNHIFWDTDDQSYFMVMYHNQNVYYRLNDKLHMKGWYNDTVYTFNDNGMIFPKFYIDLGKHKIPDELIPERISNGGLPPECYWVGVNESAGYVFMKYGYHYDRKDNQDQEERPDGIAMYNKITKKGVTIKNEPDRSGFINDMDGGPDFYPKYSNDTLVYVNVAAIDLKEWLDSEEFENSKVLYPELKEKLIQINETLKEDDNHYLMIVKLKD